MDRKQYFKNYQLKNKDKLTTYNHQYYKTHLEQSRQRARKSYHKIQDWIHSQPERIEAGKQQELNRRQRYEQKHWRNHILGISEWNSLKTQYVNLHKTQEPDNEL